MSLYWWNFEIKVIPDAPRGINQATPPPLPETVSTAPTKVADLNSAVHWSMWLTSSMMGSKDDNPDFYLNQLRPAIEAGNLNLLADPWPQAIKYAGKEPPYRTVQLVALASWEQIYSTNNMGGTSEYKTATKRGVTTSRTDQESFSYDVGVSASAGWGPISATMSASFTKGSSTSRTISFSEETTVESNFSLPASSYVQIWQLKMHVRAGQGGPMLTEYVQSFQSLTYPPRTETMSKEEIEAMAKEEEAWIAGLVRR